MFQTTFKRSLTGIAASALIALSVSAQVTPSAFAQRSPQATAQFLSNPGDLLAKSPNGGAELVGSVRDLVSGDAATLQPIINLIANANKDQKAAIGAGLAQAAKIVVRTNPAFATEIQQAILNTKDQDVVLAFAAGAGDRPIGAAGGAGGGGAGGGQTNPLQFGAGSGGGAEKIGGNGTNTNPFSYTSGVSGLGNTFTNNTSGTVSSSVSP
ncbi:hypothetical protein [Bradyrhizobium japonicum]|uniref:hypothetical protein n=1 Tax=Bradyrhizobium japonicum TaxID=375 RepID=UPI000675E17C|nr:hypothetical protein [Bradyrhizobium japonicum]